MKLSLCLSVFFLLNACGVAPEGKLSQDKVPKPGQAQAGDQKLDQKPDLVAPEGPVIRGTLTEEGVVCQAMRGDNDTLYVFETLPDGLKVGDQLRVERDVPAVPMPSHCDQGEVIKWTAITKLENGKPGQIWRK